MATSEPVVISYIDEDGYWHLLIEELPWIVAEA